jgi:uncharacterized membrane protein
VIDQPFALAAVLASSVALVLRLERVARLEPFFRRLPAILWIFLLPVLGTTCGLLPSANPLYPAFARYLLPTSLVLLLLSSDLTAIARLGPRALGAMAAGALGIALGAVVALFLFGAALGPEAWKGLAALVGTWIGGSANLVAVSTALGLSPETQGIAILVDTLVGYGWMGVLIALSSRQAALDRALGADRSALADVARRVAERAARERRPFTVVDATTLVALALALSATALALGRRLPAVGEVLSPFAWAILLVTTAGLALSLTPVARLEGAGASSLGYAAFYLLLASVGAQADLKKIVSQPVWIAAGATVILVHALVLALAVRLLRAPSFFFGAASQACTGGVASAPVVAQVWQPGLAPVGLLLAVVGNVVGTYAGLATAQLLSALS